MKIDITITEGASTEQFSLDDKVVETLVEYRVSRFNPSRPELERVTTTLELLQRTLEDFVDMVYKSLGKEKPVSQRVADLRAQLAAEEKSNSLLVRKPT